MLFTLFSSQVSMEANSSSSTLFSLENNRKVSACKAHLAKSLQTHKGNGNVSVSLPSGKSATLWISSFQSSLKRRI